MAVEFDDLLPRKRQPEALAAASTLDFSDLTGEPALGTAAASGNVAGTDIPSDPKSRIVGKVYTDTQGAPRRWNGASFDFGDAARETTALEVAGGTLGNIAQGFVRVPKAITDLANAVIPGRSYDFNTDAYNEAINAYEQAKPAAYRAEADNGGIIERTSDGRVVGIRAPSGEAVGGAIAQSLVQAPMFMAGGAGATGLASRVLPNLPRTAQFLGYGATNAALVAPGQGDDTRREALANGYDEATAARMGDQALLETGALTFGTGGAGGALSLFGGSTARSLPRALLRGGIAEVPFESAEEAGQSAINDRALGQPVDWSRAADAGALGAFAGFASGAPLGGMEYLSHTQAPIGAPVTPPTNQSRVEPTWRQTPQGLELDIVGRPDAVAPTAADTESAIDALLTRNIPAGESRPAPVLDAERITSMLGDIVSENPDAAAALAQAVNPTAVPAPTETAQPSPSAVGSGLGDGALINRLFTPEIAAALGLPSAADASPVSVPASPAPASAPAAPSAQATAAPASRAGLAGPPSGGGTASSAGSDVGVNNSLPVTGYSGAKVADDTPDPPLTIRYGKRNRQAPTREQMAAPSTAPDATPMAGDTAEAPAPAGQTSAGAESVEPDNRNLSSGTRVGDAADIIDLAQRTRAAAPTSKEAIRYAKVTPASAQAIREATGLDVSGYHHVVDGPALRHAIKQHSDEATEAKRGQLPLTDADFARIPAIVASPDAVEAAGTDNAGRTLIRYRKRFNGTTYYVEEVRSGRHELAAKTMWKAPTRDALPAEASARPTPEATGGNLPQPQNTSKPVNVEAQIAAGGSTRADTAALAAEGDKARPGASPPKDSVSARDGGASENLDNSRDITYDEETSDRADDWLQQARAEQSIAEGEADADRYGLRDAVSKLLADAPRAPRVEYLRDIEGLPDRLRAGVRKRAMERGPDSKVRSAAMYDPATGRVFVFTDVVKTPESVQWQVAHEIAGHHGLRTLLGDKLNKALELALQNPTVKLLAEAIAKERKSNNRLLMAEESLAELAAAVRTGDFDKIAQRYGVTVPEGMRGGIKAAIENFLRRLKALFGQQGIVFKDAQARELLEAAWQAAREGGATRSDSDAGLESVDYTPEQQEFLRKSGLGGAVDQKTTLQRVAEWVQGKTPEFDKHSLVQSGLDHYYGIKRAAAEKGGIPIERDPYIAARQINTASTMEAVLRFGGPKLAGGALRVDRSVPALLDALKPVSNQMPQFLGWMVARRAKLLKAQGRERLMSDADIEAGLSFAKGHEAEFTKAALGYLKLKNAILDLAEQTGEIDPIARAAWDHAEYLPFYRDAEATTGAGTRQGLANQSAGIRSLKGGESALADPLSNIIQNFTRLVDASMKNRAAMLAVDELGAPYFRPAALTVKPEAMPLDQVRKHLESTGVDAATIASMPESALKGVAKMLSIKAPEGDDIIRIMRGGKAEYYHVDDPLLLRSLTAFSEKPTHLAVKILQWQKNLLTAGATATMDFLLANGFRDTGEAAVTSQDRFIPVWDTLRGAIDSLRDSELSQDLMMAGSAFHSGLFRSGDTDATASAIRRALRKHSQSDDFIERYVNTLINPAKLLPRAWDGYRRLSEASEAGSRISLARLRLESGAPFIEAAHEAKDFLDFQLRGDDGFVQFFLKTIPFLNARAQGAYRLGRVGTTRGRVGKLAVGLATMAAASTALMLWNAAMYADGWDELEDWDKDANWHIAPGTKYHQRIPKPFELGYLGGTLPERIYAALRYQLTRGEEGDRPEQSLDSVMHLFTGTLMINPIPQGVKPIVEDTVNKDFYFGSPIEGMGDKYKAPSDRYGPTTSPTMREASKAMAAVLGEDRTLSPKRLAHLWRGYTAGMGQYALSAADMLTRTATDAPARPEMRLRDWPVIGRFARGGSPAPSTRYTEEFYDLDEKAGIQSRTIKEALKQGDEKRARQVEAEYGWLLGDRQSTKRANGGFMHSGVRELDRASREMAKLRKEDATTYESRTMTPAEKRTALDTNAKKRNDLARKLVRQMRERERAAR